MVGQASLLYARVSADTRWKDKILHHPPVKYEKASNMECKGPFDARFEASESSRRALSDYAIQNVQTRNFSKTARYILLPQNSGKKFQKTKNTHK